MVFGDSGDDKYIVSVFCDIVVQVYGEVLLDSGEFGAFIVELSLLGLVAVFGLDRSSKAILLFYFFLIFSTQLIVTNSSSPLKTLKLCDKHAHLRNVHLKQVLTSTKYAVKLSEFSK